MLKHYITGATSKTMRTNRNRFQIKAQKQQIHVEKHRNTVRP